MVEAAGTVDDHALLLLPAQLHLLEDALCRAQEHLSAWGVLGSNWVILFMDHHGRRT